MQGKRSRSPWELTISPSHAAHQLFGRQLLRRGVFYDLSPNTCLFIIEKSKAVRTRKVRAGMNMEIARRKSTRLARAKGVSEVIL